MSMHQGLDLSRFKKISCDGKTTTLKHSQGHEIKIAHNSLTPKMHEHIKNMPVHLAEGDEVHDMDPQSPEAATGSSPPEPAPAPVPQPTAQQSIAQKAQDMTAHDIMFQQDLAQGKITPKTYHDLYANKDTLGKIGTAFGLLVSGAGSGLAHQPNAVLGMMDNEIKNDLDAQKYSNENAQNWYRLNQAHELQKAQIEKMGVENLTELGRGAEQATKADLARAQLRQLPGADTTLSTKAMNGMMLGYGQWQQDQINKMPPGPMRDQAQATLDNTVKPAIMQKVTANNIKAAGNQHLANTMTGKTEPQKSAPVIDYGKLNGMIKDSRIAENLHMVPKLTESDISKIQDEASQLETLRKARDLYHHAFTKLWNAPDKGSINKNLYAAETGTLGPIIARETAGKFVLSEADKQAGGAFPSYQDYISGAGQEKYNNMMKYFDSKEAALTGLQRVPEIVSKPPTYPSPFEKEKKSKDSGKYKTVNGKKYKRGPNGEAVEVP